MAADRQRLAQALAAEAARRRLFESIPEAAGQGLPQAPERPMGWNDYLENLSIGLGRGAVSNLEGIKGMVTSPVESLKGVATGVAEAVRNPRMVAEALKQTGQRAMSGPLGLGEVIGENFNMARVPSAKPVMSEINVYHGSPHKFDAFDASKIGTGEGAQAYGHGIYLAEQKDVADMYRRALTPHKVSDDDAQSLASYAMRQRHDSQSAIDWLTKQKAAYKTEQSPETLAQYDAAIKVLQGGNVEKVGNLYTADLPDEMVDRMLDWDKPLSEQPEAVQQVIEMLKPNMSPAWQKHVNPKTTGQSLYIAAGSATNRPSDAAMRLKDVGIPGIRYLDAGSRGAGGNGTRNFVVFPGEEKKVKILKRE